MERIGGIIEVVMGATRIAAKGAFKYNLGRHLRTTVIGASEVLGVSEKAQAAYIEGETVHTSAFDLEALTQVNGETVNLTLPNGKTVVLRGAWYVADGEGDTEEGAVKVRFEGKSAEII